MNLLHGAPMSSISKKRAYSDSQSIAMSRFVHVSVKHVKSINAFSHSCIGGCALNKPTVLFM